MTAGAQFFDDFIDDYFSECEEHMATVRRVLLAIESQAPGAPDPVAVQELVRALHTLKGLSGMVGLSSAEETAHAMEDAVRVMPADRGPPPALLECLFVGTKVLAEAVDSRRARREPPSASGFILRVRDLIDSVRAGATEAGATSPGGKATSSESLGIERASHAERRFEFTPSAGLAARGVGVEIIRQRLSSLGEITTTVPRVPPGGGVIFEFEVKLRENAVPPEEWRNEGLSWTPWPAERSDRSTGVVVHAGRPTSSPQPPTMANVVRADLSRLDDLMRMIGELVVTRARLGDSLVRTGRQIPPDVLENLTEASDAIERQLRSMREGVLRIRLVQIGEVFERMRFAMRDIARESGKTIHLEFAGQETEIDKLVVDRMLEPLLHLVRNSASHGIEDRATRIAAGKSADGTISLRAQASGDRITLEVEDDGAGIDVLRVARRAKQLGLALADALEPDALLDVICASGFSTRETADMVSGRGVGMAVVRATIRSLGGELFVDSILGQRTRFTIELPLTLMITDALVFEVGDQAMAIPQVALREILPLDPAAVTRFEKNEVMSHRGRVVPLVDLGTVFNLAGSPGVGRHVLIVGSDQRIAGLVVDSLLGLREIVVHPVDDPLVTVPGIMGATELANGRVSLIIDAPALVRGTRSDQRPELRALHPAPTAVGSTLATREGAWA